MKTILFPFLFLIILQAIFGSCRPKDKRVFTRSDLVNAAEVETIHESNYINQLLHKRGGDTLFSLFPIAKRMALIPRPEILVFNQQGEMLENLCHANFGSEEKVLRSIEKRKNRPLKNKRNLFDLLNEEHVNGKEVIDRIPGDFDRYVLIPWAIADTGYNHQIEMTSFDAWIKPVMEAADKSEFNFLLLWECVNLSTEQEISKVEYRHLFFDAMKARFPDNFKEDHKIEKQTN